MDGNRKIEIKRGCVRHIQESEDSKKIKGETMNKAPTCLGEVLKITLQ